MQICGMMQLKYSTKGSDFVFGAKELQLSLHHARVDYITFGKGPKILVMIPGLNTRGVKGSSAMLSFMYRIFAKDYTVYVFDHPAPLPADYTVSAAADWLSEAMDALELKNADVFGVSQGGMVAQYLALQRPDLVNKLVLAVTLSRTNAAVKDAVETWLRLLEAGALRQFVEDMARRMYSAAYVKRYKPFFPLLALLQKPKDPQRFKSLARACLTCDTYEQLENIRCPVLVLGGAQDKIVTAQASREIAEKLHCQLYLYENLGHAAYEEAADFNRRVLDFFQA